MERINISKASITELEIKYSTDAASAGWGSKCEEYIKRFEDAFKSYIGTKYSIATSSCTGALHMGLSAIGVGPGDEVILADINWIASAAPITYLGATPVFVDVLPDTWCIDPKSVEKAITSKTKAIIAVHLYGNLCDMSSLRGIWAKYGIPIIEDSAEAIGSEYFGKKAGSMGNFGVFSFHGSKTITTGEGGMFVTNDPDLYERVLTISKHGRSKGQSKQFWPDVIGFKYKMTNMQAAIGCAQLERIDSLVSARRKIFDAYKENLSNLPISMNPEPKGTVNGYWMPTILVDEGIRFDRDKLIEDLNSKNVDGRVFFWPLSSLQMFEEKRSNIVSYSVFKRGINLPSYYDLSIRDVKMISQIVRENINRKQ